MMPRDALDAARRKVNARQEIKQKVGICRCKEHVNKLNKLGTLLVVLFISLCSICTSLRILEALFIV